MNLDPAVVPQSLTQNGVHLTSSLRRSDNINVVRQKADTARARGHHVGLS